MSNAISTLRLSNNKGFGTYKYVWVVFSCVASLFLQRFRYETTLENLAPRAFSTVTRLTVHRRCQDRGRSELVRILAERDVYIFWSERFDKMFDNSFLTTIIFAQVQWCEETHIPNAKSSRKIEKSKM